MSKLSYDRDVKTLLESVKQYYYNVTGKKISMRESRQYYSITEEVGTGYRSMFVGTLRECYSYLLGIRDTMH